MSLLQMMRTRRSTSSWGILLLNIALVCVPMVVNAWSEDLKYSRMHVVDKSEDNRNWLFRGNFPGKNGSYAYTELIQDLHKRALNEGNAPLPDNFELHVINFNNPLEYDFFIEKTFFYEQPSKGDLTIWPLVGAVIPPNFVDNKTREDLINDPDLLFIIDMLPFRLQKVYNWVHTRQETPQVLYWHCEAGCDRTGEASGAYYMRYLNYNVTAAFDRDTRECGRPPNYFSKGMISWYCLYLANQTGRNLGDCLNF